MVQLPRTPQAILRVENLQRSVNFYQQKLGFTLESLDSKAGTALLRGRNQVPLILALHEADVSAWPRVPESRPNAWVYMNDQNIPALAQELKERNVQPLEIVQRHPGYHHMQVTDPDGYVVTFWRSWSLPDDQVLDLYRTGPDKLEAALAGLTETDLDLPRAPGKWTIREIVHHIVDADMGTYQVLRLALGLPGYEIKSNVFNPDEWNKGIDCTHRPIGPAVALLKAARAWVMEVVEHLPDSLDRYAQWPSGYKAEVRDLLRQVGNHALHHIDQIEDTRRKYGR